MGDKKEVSLDIYNVYDAIIPLEYFEVYIQSAAEPLWKLFFVDKEGKETEFGPLTEKGLLDAISAAPFFFDEIVFVYYLVEHKDEELKELGVRLLKLIANA